MGMRFRKSFTLAPGIRMNLSGSGLSWSVGPRGASLSFGKRGTYLNTGIPGTGLYSRERIDSGGSSSGSFESRTITAAVSVHIGDDGTVSYFDENGNLAPESWVAAAKKQQGDAIKNLIQNECDKINEQVNSLGEIHLHTPDPSIRPHYMPAEFEIPKPTFPELKKIGFIASLFKSKRELVKRENDALLDNYFRAEKRWADRKLTFEETELKRVRQFEEFILTDLDVMMAALETNLQSISWPRETLVSFDLYEGGKCVYLDVDLPEIEDMPSKTASIPSRGYKLTIKQISAAQLQKLYMRHVHGIGFRIIGEVFATLPTAEKVVLSAYSQRPDPATGNIRDDYLYSVQINRTNWQLLNFNSLESIDVVECFSGFDLRREMLKSGIFKPISPFSPQ